MSSPFLHHIQPRQNACSRYSTELQGISLSEFLVLPFGFDVWKCQRICFVSKSMSSHVNISESIRELPDVSRKMCFILQ